MAADQLLQALKNRCGLRSRLGTSSTHSSELSSAPMICTDSISVIVLVQHKMEGPIEGCVNLAKLHLLMYAAADVKGSERHG